MYAIPHDANRWAEHRVRVGVTIALARHLVPNPRSVADLSCGNGEIASAVGPNADTVILGDLAPGYEVVGPLEQTIHNLPRVDLYVCSETLEHLDDPDTTLAQLRPHAATLIVSTPIGAWADAERNPEHYWAWDKADVEEMLTAAGWRTHLFNALDLTPGGGEYHYGIWGCI
jgi:hypothetical protein